MPPDVLLNLECGDSRSLKNFERKRVQSLELSRWKRIRSAHTSGVASLDLDPTEHRYLLAAAADASIAIYDTLQTSEEDYTTIQPLCTITKQLQGSHLYAISSAVWYPIDAGIFVTGSFDQSCKVWDANSLQVITSFPMLESRVFSVAMSHVSTAHALVAVACSRNTVRLCDLTSGTNTHVLSVEDGESGCRVPAASADVLAMSWSLQSEWLLASGGRDGVVRLWDVRRSGCLARLWRRSGGSTNPYDESSMSAGHSYSHKGAVNSIVPSPDGLYWVTAGTDDTIQLWDAFTLQNMHVHYPQAFNRSLLRGRTMSMSADGSTLFHPSGSCVNMYSTHTGRKTSDLTGAHFDTVNCCFWNPLSDELYTGSDDGCILLWDHSLPPDGLRNDESEWSSDHG